MDTDSLYLYCFAKGNLPAELDVAGIGQSPAPVFTVNCGNLVAVVSRVAVRFHDPSQENALAHQGVVARAMQA